jgi:MYXO-CTERM domain-containing protein
VSVPPNGNDTCGFDLSLVTLAENVPREVARPAIPRIDLRPLAGETYVAVGYGVDAQGDSTSGRMQLDGLVVQCAAERCAAGFGVAETEFLGASGVCNGDSGGQALDVEGRVIGVLSRGSDPCETPVYGGVEGFRDWIMETAIAAAAAGGYEPPLWATTGSSEVPPGMEGDPCGPTRECEAALICHAESDPELGTCTRPCAAPADCTEPQTCVTGFDAPGGGLCLTPRRPVTEPDSKKNRPPDDSCSIGAPSPASPFAPLALSLLALAFLARRR